MKKYVSGLAGKSFRGDGYGAFETLFNVLCNDRELFFAIFG